MSRKITPNDQVLLTEQEKSLCRDPSGKLIVTSMRGKNMALLLQGNRLTYATVLEESRVGSIYLARVKNIVKEISACFVEIEDGEICFLPLKDAATPFLINRCYDGKLKEGDLLPVQLTREPQKTKQATVTAHISMSTPYFCLVLGSKRVGYSSKFTKEEKTELRRILESSGVSSEGELLQASFQPDALMQPQVGLIVRTRAKDYCGDGPRLMAELQRLTEQWNQCLCRALHSTCGSLILRADQSVRELLGTELGANDFCEIVTDDIAFYEKLRAEFSELPVRLYEDTFITLEKLLALQVKLDEALNKRIWLKSGGYLVLEYTEAMTVIDVNSGKYEAKKGNAEQTAVLVNRQAAEEVALLLRLLNLSGIIIVDFINMEQEENNRALLRYLRELVQRDPIPVKVVDMTKLGLVEMTRKKIRKPLREQLMRKE